MLTTWIDEKIDASCDAGITPLESAALQKHEGISRCSCVKVTKVLLIVMNKISKGKIVRARVCEVRNGMLAKKKPDVVDSARPETRLGS